MFNCQICDRENRPYTKSQAKNKQFQFPPTQEADTFFEALRQTGKAVEGVGETIQNMSDNIKQTMDEKEARIEKKFDGMIDMMTRLLARMDQQAAQNQNQPQNQNNHTRENSGVNGNNTEVNGRDRTANTRGSTSRPIFPTFTPRKEQPQVEATIPFANDARQAYMEYISSPPNLRDQWTFDQFMNQRNKRNGGRKDHRPPVVPRTNYQQALGKVTLAHFDGSDKCTDRSWVQKLDNYLSLRPMPEEDAIKFVTLHLEGVAHKWWYHGLVTLGHNLIHTYEEFTNRLIENFDSKDPEVKFRELAQLKQHGTLEAYVADFQILSVMVPNITERRLVVLFIEGLLEPLRGWLKAFDPPTLQKEMIKARSM